MEVKRPLIAHRSHSLFPLQEPSPNEPLVTAHSNNPAEQELPLAAENCDDGNREISESTPKQELCEISSTYEGYGDARPCGARVSEDSLRSSNRTAPPSATFKLDNSGDPDVIIPIGRVNHDQTDTPQTTDAPIVHGGNNGADKREGTPDDMPPDHVWPPRLDSYASRPSCTESEAAVSEGTEYVDARAVYGEYYDAPATPSIDDGKMNGESGNMHDKQTISSSATPPGPPYREYYPPHPNRAIVQSGDSSTRNPHSGGSGAIINHVRKAKSRVRRAVFRKKNKGKAPVAEKSSIENTRLDHPPGQASNPQRVWTVRQSVADGPPQLVVKNQAILGKSSLAKELGLDSPASSVAHSRSSTVSNNAHNARRQSMLITTSGSARGSVRVEMPTDFINTYLARRSGEGSADLSSARRSPVSPQRANYSVPERWESLMDEEESPNTDGNVDQRAASPLSSPKSIQSVDSSLEINSDPQDNLATRTGTALSAFVAGAAFATLTWAPRIPLRVVNSDVDKKEEESETPHSLATEQLPPPIPGNAQPIERKATSVTTSSNDAAAQPPCADGRSSGRTTSRLRSRVRRVMLKHAAVKKWGAAGQKPEATEAMTFSGANSTTATAESIQETSAKLIHVPDSSLVDPSISLASSADRSETTPTQSRSLTSSLEQTSAVAMTSGPNQSQFTAHALRPSQEPLPPKKLLIPAITPFCDSSINAATVPSASPTAPLRTVSHFADVASRQHPSIADIHNHAPLEASSSYGDHHSSDADAGFARVYARLRDEGNLTPTISESSSHKDNEEATSMISSMGESSSHRARQFNSHSIPKMNAPGASDSESVYDAISVDTAVNDCRGAISQRAMVMSPDGERQSGFSDGAAPSDWKARTPQTPEEWAAAQADLLARISRQLGRNTTTRGSPLSGLKVKRPSLPSGQWQSSPWGYEYHADNSVVVEGPCQEPFKLEMHRNVHSPPEKLYSYPSQDLYRVQAGSERAPSPWSFVSGASAPVERGSSVSAPRERMSWAVPNPHMAHGWDTSRALPHTSIAPQQGRPQSLPAFEPSSSPFPDMTHTRASLPPYHFPQHLAVPQHVPTNSAPRRMDDGKFKVLRVQHIAGVGGVEVNQSESIDGKKPTKSKRWSKLIDYVKGR